MMQTIEQQDFLQEYLNNRIDFILQEPSYDEDGDLISIQAGSDYIEIHIFEDNMNYYCKITSIELGTLPVANFILPETFEEYNTLMNIFLNQYTFNDT